jgi:hypothetical protein
VYPGLSAVDGGHDFGRDADIYFPLDSAAAGLLRRGRLLATTGDARADVARALARMREEGLSVGLLVVRPVARCRPGSAGRSSSSPLITVSGTSSSTRGTGSSGGC